MDLKRYLKRIDFTNVVADDYGTLAQLHEQHVFCVPFENLDIHYKTIFDLEPDRVYNKVVVNSRGGFCYELNSLFNALLKKIGFKSKIISARIINDDGTLGPAYDHMAIVVQLDNRHFLLDVGYGDLFVRPLEITTSTQSDGRNFFKIDTTDHENFKLSMSVDNLAFRDKYMFSFQDVSVDDFREICLEKQLSPNSYFVRNIVCTKPTSTGRITLFNDKLIERRNQDRLETPIRNDHELRSQLATNFGLIIKGAIQPE